MFATQPAARPLLSPAPAAARYWAADAVAAPPAARLSWPTLLVWCVALACGCAVPLLAVGQTVLFAAPVYPPAPAAPLPYRALPLAVPPQHALPTKLLATAPNDDKAMGEKKEAEGSGLADEVERTMKKWGLEAGLWKAWRSGDKSSTEVAKALLSQYGIAYLATSITLSIISFGTFWVLVSNGIDVSAVLQRVGINVSATTETAGTFAFAYAAHKAASPIRFPPTVALTPLVARWLGKGPAPEDEPKA